MRYTTEQNQFIRDNVKGVFASDLTKRFNERFGTSVTVTQIRNYKKDHKLLSGITPKDFKGIRNSPKTEFKKGNKPYNWKPVGSERINIEGYIEVKVKEPRSWRFKHIMVWEKHNGRKVPDGHKVSFADQNRLNIDPDNLIIVTDQEHLVMNRMKLYTSDKELTKAGASVAKLTAKIYEIDK